MLVAEGRDEAEVAAESLHVPVQEVEAGHGAVFDLGDAVVGLARGVNVAALTWCQWLLVEPEGGCPSAAVGVAPPVSSQKGT